MALVYLITNIENGKRYVGKTKSTLTARWYQHTKDAKCGSAYAIHRAIRLYGAESFNREVLGEYASEEEALLAEITWIAKLGTVGDRGYNMTGGGRGTIGYRHTDEDRKRMSEIAIAKGQRPSPEARLRAKEVMALGMSPEWKANIKASQIKRRAENPVTEEFRSRCRVAKLKVCAEEREAGIIRTQTEETIAKRVPKLKESWALRKAAGWEPTPVTDEFRAKMAVINGERARSKPIRTTCIVCNVTLSTENAMANSRQRSGLHRRCRACETAHQLAWHDAHPGYEAARARRRRSTPSL